MGNHDDSYGVDDSFTDGAGTVYDTDSPKHAATDQDQSETHQARQDANAMSAFQTFDSDSPSQGSRQLFIEIRNQKPVFTTQSLGASPNTYPSSSQPSPGASTPSGAIPFYDPHSRDPVNPFITYLVDEFFTYVGYNFPFLRQGPFMRNLARKQICTLLVDAVCAVSARFSSDNLVTKASRRTASSQFSARAKSLVLTELQTPTLAAVQACLLLAYADFGTNKDAGIWMLLGISTKMAQFLGLHRIGKEANPAYYDTSTVKSEFEVDADDAEAAAIDRCNTFWAVYHLDQAISTITGRPVAFNDQIELDLLSPEEAGRWNNSVWTLIKRRDAMDQVQSGFQPSG